MKGCVQWNPANGRLEKFPPPVVFKPAITRSAGQHLTHGGESRDLNDRAHRILCRYLAKTST